MTDKTLIIITGILAIAALYLFFKSESSRGLTDQKRDEVKRKRAALIERRKAEERARKAKTEEFGD